MLDHTKKESEMIRRVFVEILIESNNVERVFTCNDLCNRNRPENLDQKKRLKQNYKARAIKDNPHSLLQYLSIQQTLQTSHQAMPHAYIDRVPEHSVIWDSCIF